jgi:hypothetical protein
MSRIIKRIALGILVVLTVAWGALSVFVEFEAEPRREILHSIGSAGRALIVLHPSRADGFQEELTAAFAQGLAERGWSVERATASSSQVLDLAHVDLVAFGTNTYYWRPDLATLRVLSRLNLQGKPCVGLVSGAGSTGRAEQLLREAIVAAGGRPVAIRPFWLWRPNDKTRMAEPNRAVALDLARKLGREASGLAR